MCVKEQPHVLVCHIFPANLSSKLHPQIDILCYSFRTKALTDSEQLCASMWTKEESDEIQQVAKEVVPCIKTMAIPEGLQVLKGPDGVLEFLMDNVPRLIES